MSKNLFTKFFVLLLVVGLLFAAVPTGQALAQTPTGYELVTREGGTATISADQFYSSGSSVKFTTGDVLNNGDVGMLRFTFPDGFTLDELTALNYWEFVDARESDLDVFLDIWLDFDNDGVATTADYPAYMQAEPLYTWGSAATLDTWTYVDGMAMKWSVGVTVDDPYNGPTIAQLQANTVDPKWTNNVDFGQLDILRIDIRVGYGYPTWNNFIGYADDITINGYVETFTPNEVWVDDNFTSATPGWGVTHFANIQSGIAAVAAGGTVNVAAGTYNEVGQIVINKNVSIVGAGASQVTIKPTGNTGSVDDARGWFLVGTQANPNVVFNLSGVTLDGAGYNIHTAIRSWGTGTITNNVIQNIRFGKYVGIGMYLYGQTQVTYNTLQNIERIGFYANGMLGPTNSVFAYNTYIGKGLGDWLDYAFEVERGAKVTIDHNTISNCQGTALSDGSGSAGILASTYFGLGTEAIVTNNTFTNNMEGIAVGYTAIDASKVTATGNTFTGNIWPVVASATTVDMSFPNIMANNTFDRSVYIQGGTYIGSSIQEAINDAVGGETIIVGPGTYNEAVNVNKAVTIVGTGNIETFTDPITIGATQAPETWYTDRYSPGVFANSTFLGEPVLLHGIRAVDLQPTPFYNTQGRKFDIGLTGPTQLISIDMFVGEDWGTKTRYSGFWATGLDSEDAVSSYPILAWRNNEGDGPGFFAYDYNTRAWLKLRDAVPQDYGKWHTFEIELTVGTGVKYFVDGTSLLTFADADTVSLGNVILNAKNFGEDYDVYWDNFAAHDTKVVGQMSINASDVAINGLILSNPGQTYGMLIDDAVSNIDITENIFEDIGSPTLSQNVKGIYLQYGPDDVLIQDNLFQRIQANTYSVNAIFSGDSNSTSPAEQLQIQDNRFLNITSQAKGGYGILLNNGAGNPGAIIDGNRFSGISGGWTHAIGLEGPTADAEVTDNTFYNLTALSPDNLAVLFEDNPGGGSVEVSSNRFQNVGYGVGVNPDDITAYGYTVDATLNYWGSPCGPAAGVADVGPNVTYNPIYTNVELTATGAGVSGSYTFPTGSTTEFMNTTIACAAPKSTLTFDGTYPGGIIVPADRTDLTFKLSNDTVITGTTEAGYCINVFGDHIRIETENFEYGLPKCIPAGDSSGIYVNWTPFAFGMPADNEVLDLIIDGLEIDGTDMTQSGITLSSAITDVQIINNYIHHCSRALTADHDIQGRFDIQGNMFKDNTSNIVDLASSTQGIVASYNSWGVYLDPTQAVVGDATYTPWTHMELFIEHVAGSSPWVNQLVSNNTMEITYAVKADMKEITGAEFLLKIPAGLTVKSATAADVFDTQSAWAVPGGVQYYGAQFDPTAAGSAPVTGQAITLFTVTLTASAPGTYDLTIDETTDAFSMLPPMEPAPSTWVYLDEAHKATLKAITLPTLATTLTANYQVGVVQEFTVTITNPTTGGLFTEPVLVFTGLPAGTTLEYFDGTNWVPFTGAITPDLTFGVTPVVVELQFRVTFTAPAGAYAITITLNDSLTDPDEFLAQTSGTATVTLLTTPLVGTLSMQGRAFRGDIPMTLTPTTLTGFAACTKKSINHISDNITFVGCLVGDTYVITTNQERYLDVTVVLNRTINLLTPDYIITALELKAGDADDSNNIDVSDAGIVGAVYGIGGNVKGDVNFDGKYNIQDLALVGGNYGYDTRTLSTDPLINPYLNWVP